MMVNLLHIYRIVKAGCKNIFLHKLRSFLTALGIIFGVASVIAMLAIGQGASYEAMEQIKALGSDNVIVRSVKPPSAASQQTARLEVYGLTSNDIRRIEKIPSIGSLVSTWESRRHIWHLSRSISGRVVGTQPDYFEIMNLAVREGSIFNELDYETRRTAVVIGASIKNALFPLENPLGKQIKIGGNYFTVKGVISPRSVKEGAEFEAEDINFDVYLPLTTSREYFGEFAAGESGNRMDRAWVQYHRFIGRVVDTKQIVATASIIENILKTLHKNLDYEILVPLQLLIQAEHTARIFSIVLGAIAAISLVVGGIGIMNIMLATVTERTREIGIRRAIGAKKSDIIHQFLIESIILSAMGGLIGVFLGVLIPLIITKLAAMVTIITPWSVILAFCISVAVGITFGLYPARKAANLNPIEALRYE
jgi:putative ABC transport system permease protein